LNTVSENYTNYNEEDNEVIRGNFSFTPPKELYSITSQRIIDSQGNLDHNVDFILCHLQEPLFPRKVMTKDLGYQVEVFSIKQAVNHFKMSRYLDCRINAYPPFTDYHGINRTPISFLVMDLDLKDFGNSKERLDRALNKTLRSIKGTIGGCPTVLWTGNGYHIYQPVSGFILEKYEMFYEFTDYLDEDLTTLFIQFAEQYFTNNLADPLHNPTVKSCLLRIPGTLNSKCISKEQQRDAEVKIIQKWDGKRPPIQLLLRDFRRWLIQRKIDTITELKRSEKMRNRIAAIRNYNGNYNQTEWIEKGILQNPLPDHRKYVIWRIILPYLLNVRKLSLEESYCVTKEWLDKCNKLERLDFNAKLRIKEGLKGAAKGYLPIGLPKLKIENKELYDIIINISRRCGISAYSNR
jgi:hypothetical protein